MEELAKKIHDKFYYECKNDFDKIQFLKTQKEAKIKLVDDTDSTFFFILNNNDNVFRTDEGVQLKLSLDFCYYYDEELIDELAKIFDKEEVVKPGARQISFCITFDRDTSIYDSDYGIGTFGCYTSF